ncbi:MAG: hypothetical protein WC865_13730 [Bacteroidales bacterium]
MIQLIINNEPVDLNENSSISITEESPVFEKDSIPGGFSFPFELPASPRNNRILSHPGRIQSAFQGGFNLPFQLYLDGRLIGTGTATIQKATSLSYSAFLQLGTGDFAGKTDGKKLSDVDFGGQRTWEFKPEFTYPEDDFALFPIYNENFMDDTQFKDGWKTNQYRLNSHELGTWFTGVNSVMAISPFPYLGYVVNRIFNHFGFVLKENILNTDSDLKQLVIYNNHDSANLISVTRPVTKTIFGKRNDGAWGYIQRTVIVTTITREFNTWNVKDFLPDMLIKDFILAIRNLFNLAITIDNQGFASIVRRKDLVTSGKSVPLNAKAMGLPLVTISDNTAGVKLHWEHEQNDLLFSEGFKNIYEDPKLLRPPVDTIDELTLIAATINEIRLVKSYGLYYQYSGEEVDGVTEYSWKVFSNDFQDFIIGDKPEEYTALASTLPMIHYQRSIDGPIIRCPQAAQLSSSIIRSTSLSCSLRFLFYRGMVADSIGTLYPYGSSDAFDSAGELLPDASLSLKWQGDTGLYNQLWKDYLTWWKKRKVVTWTITDPSQLDFFTVYEINNNHYILKNRSISLQYEGVLPGDCEFYLV